MKKKLLVLLVTAALALAALPMAAFAEGEVAAIDGTEYATLQAAVAAVPTDGTQTTITLLGDTSGDGVKVAAGQNIVFELGGYTYNIDGTTVGSAGTETNGFQLLKGSTVTFQNGTITSSKAKILIQNYCDLTLNNVKLDGKNLVSGAGGYVLSNNNGSAQLLGNTSITAPDGGVAFDMYYWPKNGYVDGVKVTVNTTGTITGKIEYTQDGSTTDATAAEKNVLTIENIDHVGSFNVPVQGANITVSGGTFSEEIPAAYLAEGFAPAKNPDTGKYEVAQLPVIATVEGKDYYSLAEAAAAAAASADKTLTLKANATLDSMLTISTPGMVIDLGGFTVSAADTFQKDADNNKNHLVDITADNVIVRNGTLTAGSNNNHTLNVWNANGVQLINLTLDNTNTYGGAPLIVGASTASLAGETNIITGQKSWYGINVDSRTVAGTPTSSSLRVDSQVSFSGQLPVYLSGIYVENSQHALTCLIFGDPSSLTSSVDGLILVATDENAGLNTVVNPEYAGLQDNGDGTYGPMPAPTPTPTPTPKPTTKPSGDSSSAPAATATPAPVLDATPKTGAVSLAALPLAGLALAGLGVVTRRKEH